MGTRESHSKTDPASLRAVICPVITHPVTTNRNKIEKTRLDGFLVVKNAIKSPVPAIKSTVPKKVRGYHLKAKDQAL